MQANRIDIGVSDQGFGQGQGSLVVGQGAIARASRSSPGNMRIGQHGRLTLEGGNAAFSIEEMAGTIEGDGDLYGNVQVSNTGAIRVGPGQAMTIHGAIDLAGDIEVSGGVFELLGSSRQHWWRESSTLRAEQGHVVLYGEFDNHGRIELIDSTLDFWADTFRLRHLVMQESRLSIDGGGGGLSNTGLIEVLSGISVIGTNLGGDGTVSIHSYGRLQVGSGIPSHQQNHFISSVVLQSNAEAVFFGSTSIFNNLTVELAASNLEQPSLTADSYLGAGGSLLIESDLMGEVELGQVYKLIESDWLQIAFNDYTLPELPGSLEFLPVQTEASLALQVIDTATELPGDFNADGRVDAADYTLWRDGLSGGQFELDRLVWQKNFGRRISHRSASVPEPTSLAPAMIALLAGLRLRRAAEVG